MNLLEAALDRFTHLQPAEKEFFQLTEHGECVDRFIGESCPSVRSECIIWLMTFRYRNEYVGHRGIELQNVNITGELNLEAVQFPFPLALINCSVERIQLTDATLESLHLDGSSITEMDANGLRVNRNVYLRHGFRSARGIRLLNAEIGGSLSLTHSQITGSDGIAFGADGLKVAGSLLCHDAKINGEFRLISAEVGKHLEITCSELKGKNERALIADGLSVKGRASLESTFHGAVRLVGARIGCQLSFENAQIKCHADGALIADQIYVGGSMFLRSGFSASGAIRLVSATIQGNLEFCDARLTVPSGTAIAADGIRIAGNLTLSPKFYAEGEIGFLTAVVGRDVDCRGAQLENPGNKTLRLDGANVGAALELGDGFISQGEVSLLGVTIGGYLNCEAGEFTNDRNSARALSADESTIRQGIYFRRNFRGNGIFSFVHAKTDGYFFWRGIESISGVWLDLRSAEFGTIADEMKSWPAGNALFLNGLSYKAIDESSPSDAKSRISWLRRQPPSPFCSQPYEHLASVLKTAGDEKSANRILKAKAEDRGKYGNIPAAESVWHWILGLVVGYGYYPWRALWFGVVLILISALIFSLGFSANLITPTESNAYTALSNQGSLTTLKYYPSFQAIAYSCDTFVPFIDLKQVNSWMPNVYHGTLIAEVGKIEIRTGGLLLVVFWILTLTGWVLTTIFVVALSGLVRR